MSERELIDVDGVAGRMCRRITSGGVAGHEVDPITGSIQLMNEALDVRRKGT